MSEERRSCWRCRGPMSRWNRGQFCNPCWSSLTVKERSKFRREVYNPEPEWRRERREDALIAEERDSLDIRVDGE